MIHRYVTQMRDDFQQESNDLENTQSLQLVLVLKQDLTSKKGIQCKYVRLFLLLFTIFLAWVLHSLGSMILDKLILSTHSTHENVYWCAASLMPISFFRILFDEQIPEIHHFHYHVHPNNTFVVNLDTNTQC
jgi:hypothetical protein